MSSWEGINYLSQINRFSVVCKRLGRKIFAQKSRKKLWYLGVDFRRWCLQCDYMKCSLPLAQFSVFNRRFSVPGGGGLGQSGAGQLSTVTRCSLPVTSYSARRAGEAFTLIELLVVIAVIAILAGLTLSTLGYANKKGADSRAQAEVAALSAAIESYKLDVGVYPADVASLYSNLCPPVGKVYFEPRPQMLKTNGSTVEFADPWDNAYGYSNFTSYFELWSTAGGTNTNNWIRN